MARIISLILLVFVAQVAHLQIKTGYANELPKSGLHFIENASFLEAQLQKEVMYYSEYEEYCIFFTTQSLIFAKTEKFSEEEAHERREKQEHGESVKPEEWYYFEINFKNANDAVELIPSQLNHHTRNFQDKNNPLKTIKAKVFDKLTYKNIYDKIDLKLEFHEKGGLKYSFYVHPGANPNQIEMLYNGISVSKDSDGNLKLFNENSSFTDKAPISFVNNKVIESNFVVVKNTVRFAIADYDEAEELVIDPWLATDFPLGVEQKALEIAVDDDGNVAVVVNIDFMGNIERVLYFDAFGIFQWEWAQSNTADIAMDPVSGMMYVSRHTGWFVVMSINSSGILEQQIASGGGGIAEQWRIRYNETYNKVATGDGGLDLYQSQVTVINSDLSAFIDYEVLADPGSDMEDCVLFEVDPDDGSYYFLACRGAGGGYEPYANRLYKFNGANPNTIIWESPTTHNFLESTNALFRFRVGVNGIACGPNFVYTYDGNRVFQHDKFSGTKVDSVFLGYPLNEQYGIDVDSCGSVYIGTADSVLVFNDDLVKLGGYQIPSAAHDLEVRNNKIHVCGTNYVHMIEIDVEDTNLELTSTPQSCETCNGTATLNIPLSGCFSLEFQSIVWSPTGDTDLEITDLCAGWHVATTLWTSPLGTDTVLVDSVLVLSESPTVPVNFVIENALCAGDCSGSITMNPLGGEPPYLYALGAESNGTGVFTELCAGTYTATVVDGNGCVMDTIITISEPAELGLSIIASSNTLCFGGNDGFLTVDAIGGTSPYMYAIDDGVFGSGLFSDLTAGIYAVTVVDDNGCEFLINVEIEEPDELVLSVVSTVDVLCAGENTGGIVVSGSGGIGDFEYAIDGGTYSLTNSFGGLTAGEHSISLKDENNCEVFLEVVLSEPTPISLVSMATHESCLGVCDGIIELEVSGGVEPYLYSIEGCSSFLTENIFDNLCANTYDICVKDANACIYSSLLTINPGIEPVNANMSPIGPLCANDSPVAIFAEDLGALSGVGVSGGSFNPGISGPGTFEITNTIVDVCGGDFATLNVIVHPIPFVQFEANKLAGCRPLAVSFLNTGDSGVDYSWGFGDGTILNSLEAVTHTYVNAGIYNVDLTISDANACQMTESYYGYIEVYELPIANFKYAPLEVTTIDLQVDFLDLSFGSESYYWSFDILQNSTVQNPSFTFPDREGTYQIEQVVISEHGCKDTIVKTIIVEQAHLIFVPNVIIPSADNNGNATFLPYMQGIDLDSYHLSIFNRWGELIFESYDLSKGWNGNYGDQGIVQDGVYIWKITAKDQDSDKVRAYQGHITVLR